MAGDRDAFAAVGAAMRAAIERAGAVRPRLRATDRAVFEAVLALTASWSRLSEQVYVAEVVALAGVNERDVRRSLKKLDLAGVIVWKPRRGIGSTGAGVRSFVSLETGAPYPRFKTGGTLPAETGAPYPRQNRGTVPPITEKGSEKSFRGESGRTWIDELDLDGRTA